MKYIIYIRASTDQQIVATQEYHCLQHVNRHMSPSDSYIIFSDPDTSTKLPMKNRLGLQEALNAMKKGDQFIAQRLDRVGRNILELAQIRQIIINKKCRLVLVDQPGLGDNDIYFGAVAGMASEDANAPANAQASASHTPNLEEDG